MLQMSEKISVGDGIGLKNQYWSFEGDVASVFDQHVAKSVPFYSVGHDLIVELSSFFLSGEGAKVLDVGSSTGLLAKRIADVYPNADVTGIDLVDNMVLEANKNHKAANLTFRKQNFLEEDGELFDSIIMYYTLQFNSPAIRQELVDKVYRCLNWGGAFFLFEKVRGNDARFQDIFTGIYNDFKSRQGYSPEQIMAKSKSLRGVLEPFSSLGNYQMLERSGFADIAVVFKWACFEGILAIK